MRRLSLLFLLLGACNCPGEEPNTPDLGVPMDSGLSEDVGFADASEPIPDATVEDASVLDGGESLDVGIAMDSGTALDASSPDAGESDSGVVTPIVGPEGVFLSVEAIPNSAVVDTGPIRALPLDVRAALVRCVLACGRLNSIANAVGADKDTFTVDVVAGGFAGNTNPAIGIVVPDESLISFEAIDDVGRAAGFVFSQGSIFELDADGSNAFGFPGKYAIVVWPNTPTLDESAAFFEAVGGINPDLFSTFSSGYTQFGERYISLKSDVPDTTFVAGYETAAANEGLVYTPAGALFVGNADFPGNDWTLDPDGTGYLDEIPASAHTPLIELRQKHLKMIGKVLRDINEVDVEYFDTLACG